MIHEPAACPAWICLQGITVEWFDWLCRWGEMSQNRSHKWAYGSSSGWYVSVEESWLWRWCRLGKLLSRPPELSGSPTSKDIWEQVRGMDEGVRILQHAIKSYDMRPPALFLIRSKMCCGFLSPLKIHRLGQVWTRDPWVQWQAH
jgi:hypothetical protein